MHIGCEISFNESWRAPEPIDGICSVLPSTEELETVISTLARRDELRRQQLCSVPKKYELLGLRSKSGFFFGKKVRKWSDFGQYDIDFCLKFSDLFAKKSRFWTKAQGPGKSNHLGTLHYLLLQNASEI